MKKTNSTNLESKVVSEMFKGSKVLFSGLGKTHEAKIKIIKEDKTMSTRDKIDALNDNDNQLIMNWLKIGVGIAAIAVLIKNGTTLDYENIKKIGQYLAA